MRVIPELAGHRRRSRLLPANTSAPAPPAHCAVPVEARAGSSLSLLHARARPVGQRLAKTPRVAAADVVRPAAAGGPLVGACVRPPVVVKRMSAARG